MADEIAPFGDSALLVTLGRGADRSLTVRARAIAEALGAAGASTAGLGRPIPAHASVLVPFDPLVLDREAAVGFVRRAMETAPDGAGAEPDLARTASAPSAVEIPVRYGGDDGPDLDAVAGHCGLRPEDVIELHAGARYEVLFLGFAPGFAYLGGLPVALSTPRRASPRERVPAGSVAIAGEQSAVYPQAMPGGWNLIGRTDTVLFDPARTEPALLSPGAAVRFVPAR